MLTSKTFWSSTVETAIKTAAAAALAVIGTDQLLTVTEIGWTQVAGVSALAFVVSILTAIAIPNPDIRAVRREAKLQQVRKEEAEAKRVAAAAKRKATAAKK